MTDDEKEVEVTEEAAVAAEEKPAGGSAAPKSKRAAKKQPPPPQRSLEQRLAERAAKRSANAAERRRGRAKSREKRRAEGPRTGTPPAERRGTGSPRFRQGVVVSDKADKTIVVRIDLARQHRTYAKIVRTSTKLHAHDERNEAGTGDTVRVVESRPLSATKRWRLVEIMERAR